MDPPKLRKIVGEFRPEVVVHLAARTDVDGRSVTDYCLNFDGTRYLIDALGITGQRCASQVLFVSSQLVCRVGYLPQRDDDYDPSNPYGESKVLMEKTIREHMPSGITWCILRPTTIWGEGMSAHYMRFLSLLRDGHYFHLGTGPLYKSYGYVGNSAYQIMKLINAEENLIERKVFYISDYQPLSLTAWTNSLAAALGARRPHSIPIFVARILGLCGDVINWLGFKKFPLNSYRVRNITTEYIFDLTATEVVCGSLPFTVEQGISRLATWFKELRGPSPQ